MNIYVDELPKGCDSCPLLNHGKMKISSTKYVNTEVCILGDFYKYSSIDDEVDNCPLKLLENAIVPKFKIGQEVWIIFDRTLFGERLRTVEKTEIFGINVTDFIDYYFQALPCITREEEIFATKEEAEARLKEMMKSE